MNPVRLKFTRAGNFEPEGVEHFLTIWRMESIMSIKNKIRKALKSQSTYSRDLETCIAMAAGSYYAFLLAQQDIECLTSTYLTEITREGNEKLVPHPAFKVLKDTQEMVRRSLRELGLTLGTLSTGDNDPLDDMLDKAGKEAE